MKIKITVETTRLLKISRKRLETGSSCAICGSEKGFLPQEEIVDLLSEIKDQTNLHKFLAPDQTVMICLSSILDNFGVTDKS